MTLTAAIDAANDAARSAAAAFEQATRSALRRRLQLARVEEHPQWDSDAVNAITDAANVWLATGAKEAELRAGWASDGRQLDRVRREFREHEDKVVAGLSTGAHAMTAQGGLPFCACGRELATGDMEGKATEDFIGHALDVLAAERARQAAAATVSEPEPEDEQSASETKPAATGRRTGAPKRTTTKAATQ